MSPPTFPTDITATPLPTLPPRNPQSHKGTYGRAILIGGSQNMPGAIALAGLSCLRGGAGLVTLWTPRDVQQVVAGYSPLTMTRGFESWHGAEWLVAELERSATNCIAIGPGLGSSAEIDALIANLQTEILQPLLIDADGLNSLARTNTLHSPAGPRILTPHPGEFARLAGDDTLARMATGGDADRIAAATTLARRDASGQTVVLLKGHRTIIADGQQYAINSTGNPGMATAGAGDVLTGLITALVCQGLAPFAAARLGAYLHGLAGDLAAERIGQVSLVATDLIEHLPAAFCQQAIG